MENYQNNEDANVEKIKAILKTYLRELKEKYNIKEIGIFGSFARDEQTSNSDIDILVEYEIIPDLFTFIELENCLEDILKIKVDLVRKQRIRPEIKERILKEVIYL